MTELPVLHAVLTLSSVHKRGIDNDQAVNDNAPDDQERFMLQHYIKAIQYAQPLFATNDRASVRVALITCVVFVCLEFLLGHFRTAETHLQNGLKVLRETQNHSSTDADDGVITLYPSGDPVDDWIVEALSRLHAEVELFKQTYQHPCFVLLAPKCGTSTFNTINEAWQQMERILNMIFHLSSQSYQHKLSEDPSIRHPSTLFEQQKLIREQLLEWLRRYESSRQHLRVKESEPVEEVGSQLLHTYHAMANIMAGTCVRGPDESVFDSYTEQFALIVNQSADLWRIRRSSDPLRAIPLNRMNMSRSVVDVAWIPPLYFTAIKCRAHRVRVGAIKLLESVSHREGICDAIICARVARKVMKFEEGDLYKGTDPADNFPHSGRPVSQDQSLPGLPHSYRVQEVEVHLPDIPTDSVILICRQRQTNGSWKESRKEYDLISQRWID